MLTSLSGKLPDLPHVFPKLSETAPPATTPRRPNSANTARPGLCQDFAEHSHQPPPGSTTRPLIPRRRRFPIQPHQRNGSHQSLQHSPHPRYLRQRARPATLGARRPAISIASSPPTLPRSRAASFIRVSRPARKTMHNLLTTGLPRRARLLPSSSFTPASFVVKFPVLARSLHHQSPALSPPPPRRPSSSFFFLTPHHAQRPGSHGRDHVHGRGHRQ